MRRYLTRVFRLTGRATGVQQATEKTVTSAPVNISVKAPPDGEPQVEPLLGWAGEGTPGAWAHPSQEPVFLKVTNLSNDENLEGSLFWALRQPYPRVIVFEVSGVIDGQWKRFGSTHGRDRLGQFDINDPYVTIAGHTAPSPGITVIRAWFIAWTHNVVFQHFAIRPGVHPNIIDTRTDDNPDGHGFANQFSAIGFRGDNPTTGIVDHMSCTWMNRYGIHAFTSGDFSGSKQKVTVSNTFIGPVVAMDQAAAGTASIVGIEGMVFFRNIWPFNYHRHPHFTGSKGAYINNYIRGPWIHCTYGSPDLALVGNYLRWGPYPSTLEARGLFNHRNASNIKLYVSDNQAYRDNMTTISVVSVTGSGNDGSITYLDEPDGDMWHPSLDEVEIVSSDDLLESLKSTIGARPWDRDPIDTKILNDVETGEGNMMVVSYIRDWDPEESYANRNHVNFNGTTYISNQSNTGAQPDTNPDIWVPQRPSDSEYNWSESLYPVRAENHREFKEEEWFHSNGRLLNVASQNYWHPNDL